MTALAADTDIPERASPTSQLFAEVGTDSTQYYKGGIVCISTATGKVVKGSTAATLIAIGRCEENVLTGTSNTRKIKARTGTFKYANSASADLIAADDIGAPCYIVDDATVALTSNSSARSRAGIIEGVDTDGGVWVRFTLPNSVS
jgi:hypothetical protein